MLANWKRANTSLMIVLLVLLVLVSAGMFYALKYFFADNGEQQELASHNWVKMEFSGNSIALPKNYSQASEIYLFAPRDLIEKKYDFSKCKIGDKNFSLVNSSFNLTSSDFQALFLVAKINNDKKFTSIICPDLPAGKHIAVGYMEN